VYLTALNAAIKSIIKALIATHSYFKASHTCALMRSHSTIYVSKSFKAESNPIPAPPAPSPPERDSPPPPDAAIKRAAAAEIVRLRFVPASASVFVLLC
jgi:hypothetical protein